MAKKLSIQDIIDILPSLTSSDLVKLIDEAEKEREKRKEAVELEAKTLGYNKIQSN